MDMQNIKNLYRIRRTMQDIQNLRRTMQDIQNLRRIMQDMQNLRRTMQDIQDLPDRTEYVLNKWTGRQIADGNHKDRGFGV